MVFARVAHKCYLYWQSVVIFASPVLSREAITMSKVIETLPGKSGNMIRTAY
jgi:hypothetical protein